MSERGIRLLETADGQIRELIDLFSTSGDAVLSRPCPGREKLGDGTVAACALHTADSYGRIARFLDGRKQSGHERNYQAEKVDVRQVLELLSAGRRALSGLAYLTDQQLTACLLQAT